MQQYILHPMHLQDKTYATRFEILTLKSMADIWYNQARLKKKQKTDSKT